MYFEVKGIRKPDTKWHQMKKIWDACVEAKVNIPEEVLYFFGHGTPEDMDQEVDIPYEENIKADRIDIEVEDIPEDVKILRIWFSI